MLNKQKLLKNENGNVYIHKVNMQGLGFPCSFIVMSAHDTIVLSFPFFLGM